MPEQEAKDQSSRLKVSELILRDQRRGAVFLSHSVTQLVSSIAEAAVMSFGAAAASIALVDVEEESLLFTIAHGAGNEEVIGKKIPLDIGIAGYVIMSGEPLDIEDVHDDPRFHHTFAESTGYMPTSILAAPLVWADEIIGVLEVLDKTNTLRSQEQELDLLSIFADLATSAIVQGQYIDKVGERGDRHDPTFLHLSQSVQAINEDPTIQASAADRNWSEFDDLAEGNRILSKMKGKERKLSVAILKKIAEHIEDPQDPSK
jgi:signal transduction protein with GAF and PtsI domain